MQVIQDSEIQTYPLIRIFQNILVDVSREDWRHLTINIWVHAAPLDSTMPASIKQSHESGKQLDARCNGGIAKCGADTKVSPEATSSTPATLPS